MIQIGPVALLMGLLVAALYYLSRPTAAGPFTGYALRVLVAGAGAFVAGTAIGIAAFCAPADARYLCGLDGALGLGPFVSGVVMAVYARRLANSARAG